MRLASALAVCLLAAPAVAQGTLVRIRGSVRQVFGPLTMANIGSFVDAQVGDAVTMDIHIPLAPDEVLSNGTKVYRLNGLGSRVTIGTETDSFNPFHLLGFRMRDEPGNDQMGAAFVLSSAANVLTEVVVSQSAGASLWDTDDPVQLYGQTLDLTGLPGFFGVYSPAVGGGIQMSYESVEFAAEARVGTRYCTAATNSTGAAGTLEAFGSASVARNDVLLWAADLPEDTTAFFLGSRTQGFDPGAGGSAGNLCLGGSIGRYIAGGSVVDTGSEGAAALPLDLAALALPTGNVPAQVGQTWNFQLWHRDVMAGQATSNFTEALTLTFE